MVEKIAEQTGAAADERAAQTLDGFNRLEGVWQLRRRIVQWEGANPDRRQAGALAASIDASGGQSDAMVAGRLIGTARFTRVDRTTLDYREQGTLTLFQRGKPAATSVHAVREYRYRCDEGVWTIDFADGPDAGNRYLRLDPIDVKAERGHTGSDAGDMRTNERDTEGELSDIGLAALRSDWVAVDHHLCGRDLYQAVYRLHGFTQPDPALHRIVQRTTVTGPRKDYAIVSMLRRMPETDSIA